MLETSVYSYQNIITPDTIKENLPADLWPSSDQHWIPISFPQTPPIHHRLILSKHLLRCKCVTEQKHVCSTVKSELGMFTPRQSHLWTTFGELWADWNWMNQRSGEEYYTHLYTFHKHTRKEINTLSFCIFSSRFMLELDSVSGPFPIHIFINLKQRSFA